MYEAFFNTVVEWNKRTSERRKLQHAYLVIAVFGVIVAGIVGLINNELGRDLLKISGVALAIFACNAVIWGLLETSIAPKINSVKKKNSK